MFKLKVGATATLQDDLAATRHGVWITNGTFVEKGQLFQSKSRPDGTIQVTRIVPISDFDKAAVAIATCLKVELPDQAGEREVRYYRRGKQVGRGFMSKWEPWIEIEGVKFSSSEAHKVDSFAPQSYHRGFRIVHYAGGQV